MADNITATKTVKNALVLGGGGIIGFAWESGIVAGLFAGGLNVGDADIFVGTSAGSNLASQIADGIFDFEIRRDAQPYSAGITDTLICDEKTCDENLLSQLDEEKAIADLLDKVDLDLFNRILELWMSPNGGSAQVSAKIGFLAKEAPSCSQVQWIESLQNQHGVLDWPVKDLRIVTVDADSGQRCVQVKGQAPFLHSVAASSAIPGMFPTITLNNVQHMDGGVASGTNADVLVREQLESVIIIAPICKHTAMFGANADRALANEVAKLEASGARVLAISPNSDDVAVMGNNLMETGKATAAAVAGYKRGKELAAGFVDSWYKDAPST